MHLFTCHGDMQYKPFHLHYQQQNYSHLQLKTTCLSRPRISIACLVTQLIPKFIKKFKSKVHMTQKLFIAES